METALVTVAARLMFEKVVDFLQLNEKFKAMTGIKRKMEKLKDLYKTIDKVIQDVESRPCINDAVLDLLWKLKYLAYDLEDVVDYYDTKVLQKKQRSKAHFNPVRDFFSSDNQVVFKSRVGGMIKAITESLDSILLQKSILLELPQGSIRMSEPSLYRETHARNSFVVIGREPEKNKIVDMLTTNDDESNHGTVKVIAIVGMGGLGKTTLAQLVYNDQRVQAHFASSTMWTHVGTDFDPAKIMKSVLQLVTHEQVNISEMDLVRQKLEEALYERRYLLVLDDVWNEDQVKWGVLKAAFTCGARGSKILVTTRSQQVSSLMGSFNTTHQLQHLSPADCLSLFLQFAFGDQTVDQNYLMEIGGKIVEKCGGVPLAAISLASMLRSNPDKTYWSSVLNSDIRQIPNEEQKVLAVLKMSYDTLPVESKRCFAFGSLYPKNFLMRKDEMIQMWIANGFINSKRNFDAEAQGNRIFDDLALRSFFFWVPIYNAIYYTMHDLMHDLARSVSSDIYWNSDQDSVEDIGKRTYHLQIYRRENPSMTQILSKKPLYLRTFMPLYAFSCLSINLLEVFSELKFLRVLNLTDGGFKEVPSSIGNLIHLRYLNLSKNNIEVLPDSITLLSNLQYLNLSFNGKLQELPKELGNMQNLRDLDCGYDDLQMCVRLTHMPCGLSRLTNLRSLPLFIASDKTSTCSIIELEDLKLHGKMKIKFSKDFKNYSCGGRNFLKNKDLNELYIEFNGSERYDKDMLDDLCPNTRLTKLSIQHYGSPQFPTWLMELQLPNLVEVCLINCRGCEHIHPFGNLQFLNKLDLNFMNVNITYPEELFLDFMDGITHLGAEFHGRRGFPSLRELCLTWMDNLEEWSESHGDDELFPKLQSLQIFRCPKLKSMPRLPKIQHLELSYCSESILSCIASLTSLSVLRLAYLYHMTSLPSGCIRNLTSLTELEFTECRQLQSLPGDEMQHLKMLRSLSIERCDNLTFFPSEVGRLSSLCLLRLTDCPKIILQPEELVQILNSLNNFRIQVCGNNVNLCGQLQYLHTLKELSLCGAHDDGPFTHKFGYRFAIPKLSICCSHELEWLMTAEPVSSVLEDLYIYGISNLTTLPDWLRHLKSLRTLSVKNCPLLEMVPRGLKNLHMLQTLIVSNCPQLKRRCERETGEDWPIISHVPYVDIYETPPIQRDMIQKDLGLQHDLQY